MTLRKTVDDGLDDAVDDGQDDQEIDVGPSLEERGGGQRFLKVPDLARCSCKSL